MYTVTLFKFNIYFNKYSSFNINLEGWKEMFYLTMHSTHFIYGYMVSDIW